jgi:hypothetical protein
MLEKSFTLGAKDLSKDPTGEKEDRYILTADPEEEEGYYILPPLPQGDFGFIILMIPTMNLDRSKILKNDRQC